MRLNGPAFLAQFALDDQFALELLRINVIVAFDAVVVIDFLLHFGEVLVRGDTDQAVGVPDDLVHEAGLRVEVAGAVAVVNVNGVILGHVWWLDDRLHYVAEPVAVGLALDPFQPGFEVFGPRQLASALGLERCLELLLFVFARGRDTEILLHGGRLHLIQALFRQLLDQFVQVCILIQTPAINVVTPRVQLIHQYGILLLLALWHGLQHERFEIENFLRRSAP